MSKMLKILALFAVLSLLLAGCGPAPAESEPDEEEQTNTNENEAGEPEPTQEEQEDAETGGETTEIILWIMPNGADPQGAIDAELAAFEAANPGVDVVTEVVGWGDAYGRIQTAVQGGEGPCVTQMGTTWVPTFGTMGGLHEFTADELAALGGEDAFVPASWSTASVEGMTVSVPWFADVRALAYRKDVLEAIEVTPEDAFADIDSFIETLEAIRDAELETADGLTIDPFHHPGRNDWNVWQNSSMWIWAYGGDLLNADNSEVAFNSPEAVEGATRFFSLYGMGLTPADTLELNSAQADSRFGEGTSAVYLTGPWVISLARDTENSGWTAEAAENLAFAQFPAGPGGQYTFVGGSNLAIMESCQHKDVALNLLEFLMTNESQIRYANAIGMLPATLSAQNDPVFTEDPLFSVFIDAAVNGKSSVNIPQWGQVENNLQTALQSLWEDVAAAGVGSTIDEALVQERLDEAAATVNSLLAP